jgi:DNA primase
MSARRENDNSKDLIRQRLNIADIVGRYVSLKRRGRMMVGLCPFHKEKTPSFQVNPDMGVYYCFGCGKGGDLFNFVQDIDGVGFREALETLADEAGVELPRYQPRERGAPASGRQPPEKGGGAAKIELFDINKLAAEFYYQCLKGSQQAVGYFKSRGLSAETVKEFGLGYAPDGGRGLIDYLAGKGFPPERAVECGLAAVGENGRQYDRFRDRAIFPLCDRNGRVIAFAGRGLDADARPKYLNSPESALYKKSGVLYGLHKARESVRELGYIIIVEGYMDYLTLYQAGIRNVAAASGTAFTEEHAYLIKRFASKTTLVFDGDRAGLSAARRAAPILAPLGLQVSILALPGDDDPDSFVKREGAEAFLGLLAKEARPAADFLIDTLISESGDSAYDKSAVLDGLMPYARALPDEVVRDDFLDRLALRLRLDRRLVVKRFEDSLPSSGEAPPEAALSSDGAYAIGQLEEDFLRVLLADPQKLITDARKFLPADFLTDPVAKNIYSIVLSVYAEKGALDGLLDACGDDPALRGIISKLSVEPPCGENLTDELAQKVILLRRKFYKARMADMRAELAVCPEEERGPLMKDIQTCGKKLMELDWRE